jgi:hypothetical protein
VLNCKVDSDGYFAYKRITKQKSRPRTTELKMSLTLDELFEYYLNKNQHLTKETIARISRCKLIYFYLNESKRVSCDNLFPIYVRYSSGHLRCSDTIRSNFLEYDPISSTGQCARLYSDRSTLQLGIKGKFKSILYGIYQIICRIKLDKNEKYIEYYKICCDYDQDREQSVQCYFYAVADYGLDCECNKNKMNYDCFESNYFLHGNTNYFNQIKVFHLSDIYFGFHTAEDYSYRNILFDYIQLNIVQ